MIKVGWRKLLSFGPRRIGFVLAATVVVTVFAMTSFVKVTSQPTFCKSCHVMEPYFEAWETSTHANVTCTECHIPPGFEGTVHSKFMALSMVANYFTGVYKRSKPWAEIEDASCLREGCHDTRLLQGTVDFQGVTFDHTPHLEQPRRDRQLRCTSCHAQIVQGEHITVTSTTCFLCHFKPDSSGSWSDLARCTHCHNPPAGPMAADTSFDHGEVLARKVDCASCHAAEVSGDGYVSVERCNSCHAQQDHIDKFSDREFVHAKHVTEHKVECTHCHTAIRHGAEAVVEREIAAGCAECHGGPDHAINAVWSGKIKGLPESPSSMARAGMTCTSCHTGDFHLKGGGKVVPTCTPCHDASYAELWPRWQAPLERTVRDLESKARALPDSIRDVMLAALDIYKRGNPLHNPDLVKTLAKQIEGTSHRRDVESCASCHPGAGASLVSHGGRMFDHRLHASGEASCTNCHSTDSEQHGRLKISPAQCNSCHHQDVAKNENNCGTCHKPLQTVYMSSAMGEAGITCVECHTLEAGVPARSVVAQCVGCHDEGYADTLQVWSQSGELMLAALSRQMQSLRPESEIYRECEKLALEYRRDGSESVHNPVMFKHRFEAIPVLP